MTIDKLPKAEVCYKWTLGDYLELVGYSLAITIIGVGIGWYSHSYYIRNLPKPVTLQRVPILVQPSAATMLIPCTPEGLQEYYRTCKARRRMEAVK